MRAYLVDVGVLLLESDKEFELYNTVYNHRFGFYDEGQCYFKDETEAIDYVKKYVNDGVNMTYGIVSLTTLPDDFDFEEGYVEDEEYIMDNVNFCAAKIDGYIVEDFLK